MPDGTAPDGAVGAQIVSVFASSYQSCALLDDGRLKCWGENSAGQLGLGDKSNHGAAASQMGSALPAIVVPAGRTIVGFGAAQTQVSLDLHACAILDDGSLRCWGRNAGGQLGQGDTASRGGAPGDVAALLPVLLGMGRKAKVVAPRVDATCAILDNGTVKCWGSEDLGLGDATVRGDQPGELGDALPAVSLGTGRTATAIAGGDAHSCAILDTGAVKCWGRNGYGQLGVGDTASRGSAPGDMGDSLPAIGAGLGLAAGRTAKALALGSYHSCALLDDGTVVCWGMNSSSQLGAGDTHARGNGLVSGGSFPLKVVNLGAGRKATAITAGGDHTCALLDDQSIKCWGKNGSGQLGLGDKIARGTTAAQLGAALPSIDVGAGRKVKAVSAGAAHTCALLDDRSMKCWGDNTFGQLGAGDTTERGSGPNQMGNTLPSVRLQ